MNRGTWLPRRTTTALLVAGGLAAALVTGRMVGRGEFWVEPAAVPVAVGAALILVAVLSRRLGFVLALAVFALPFTQAPTVSLMLRIRISEVLLWTLTPRALSWLNREFRTLPGPVRVYVGFFGLYILYSSLLGFALAWFAPRDLTAVDEFIPHPFFRTAVESARMAASFALVIMLLGTVHSWRSLDRYIRLFVAGASASASYGIYQAFVLGQELDWPILPGTLRNASARPFSTLFEPTAFGSLSAVAMMLAAYLIWARSGPRWANVVMLGLLSAGLVVSLSRAGFVGLLVGTIVVLVYATISDRRKLWLLVPLGVPLLWAGLELSQRLLGESAVDFAFSRWSFELSLEGRASAYSEVPSLLAQNALGVGQGVYLYTGGGAPGVLRLLAEGGIPGLVLLLAMAAGAIWCVGYLTSRGPAYSVFLGAAAAATFAALFNYLQTSDAWLWFVLGLPCIGATLVSREQGARISGSAPSKASDGRK